MHTRQDQTPPALCLLDAPRWTDYTLLDSGQGQKLERFGPYTFVRPEAQALWQPSLPEARWQQADALFRTGGDSAEDGGRWQFLRPVEAPWQMSYEALQFWAQPTPFRHMGVFPEQASQWDWLSQRITTAGRPVHMLNLFGYTGLATLAASAAGAQVTHVDASRKSIDWARSNQLLSGLENRPIRWLVDDALKFVRREGRRGQRYDGIILDPPKFGRGPKGEIWKLDESLLALLQDCRHIMSDAPLFIILTAYAIRASSVTMHHVLADAMAGLGGTVTSGEMILTEQSAGHHLSTALFARWSAGQG